jgi:hypothetical protein
MIPYFWLGAEAESGFRKTFSPAELKKIEEGRRKLRARLYATG